MRCTRNHSLEFSARARLRPIRERPVGPSGASRHAVRAAAIRQQPNRSEKMAVSMAKLLSAQRCVLLVAALFHCSVRGETGSEEPPHRRFEYKYSFKGPHLTQSDGTIPFWVHTGSKFSSPVGSSGSWLLLRMLSHQTLHVSSKISRYVLQKLTKTFRIEPRIGKEGMLGGCWECACAVSYILGTHTKLGSSWLLVLYTFYIFVWCI